MKIEFLQDKVSLGLRRPCEDGGGDCLEGCRYKPRTAAHPPSQKRGRKQILPQSLADGEGINPADAWVLDFWLPEQREDTFVLFPATQFWQFAAAALQNKYDRAVPLEQGPRQACTGNRFFKQRKPKPTGPNTFCKPRAN